MNIKQLEEILNIKIQNNTIIFAFPGIGIGNVYNELSGCTLETRNMEILAKIYENKNIKFIGISTNVLPEDSKYINYVKVKNNINLLPHIKIQNNIFLKRTTIFISNNDIVIKDVTNVNEHNIEVKIWIQNIIKKGKK